MKEAENALDSGKEVYPETIPQVDGSLEIARDKYYPENYCKICEECPNDIETAEDVNYHTMNDHQAKDVVDKYGNQWILDRMYCVRRGSPFS